MALSISMKIRAIAMVIGCCLLASTRIANATPLASVDYVTTTLGGGLYRYDYTLTNLGDPLADAGFDLYDLALTFDPSVSVVSASIGDWDFIGGAGFIDMFSLSPGTDLAPEQTRSGFQIVVNGLIGNAAFSVAFTNPTDPANPLIREGAALPAAVVPEPTSLLFVTTGIVSLLSFRRPDRMVRR